MESSTLEKVSVPDCHNCKQELTLPASSRRMFHTCTKLGTVKTRTDHGIVKTHYPIFGQAGPHILIDEVSELLRTGGM